MILLPRPRTIHVGEGCFALTPHTSIVLLGADSVQELTAAKQLQEDVRLYAGLDIPILRGKPQAGDITLERDAELITQAYTLQIAPEHVSIRGGGREGVAYGVQTLRQIVAQSGAALPAVKVEDHPAFAHRGFYHDVSRGRIPTMESLRQLVDTMAAYKLNQLQLYVEHTYLFRGFSEVWRGDTPLTAEDILELDAYCDARGIELIPSLSCFGHMFEILHTKSFGSLCELEHSATMPSTYQNRMHHHTINVSDERSLSFVCAMIEAFLPLFRSKHFNICADETFDLGRGKSKALAEQVGVDRLYVDFVKGLCAFLMERGKTPMFWGDIIERMPELLHELPEETICLNWGYDAHQTDDGIRKLAAVGAIQYVCPGVAGWNQWMNRLHPSYDNITRMCRYGRENGAVGVQNTDWGDYGHINHPTFSMPGMLYGAAFSWSEEEVPFDEVNEDISRLLYRDASGKAVSVLAKLTDTSVYPWEALSRFREAIRAGEAPRKACVDELACYDKNAVTTMNEQAMQALAELRPCAATMDTRHRGVLQAWSIAVEAICLWNRVGAHASDWAVHETVEADPALAAAVEDWFRLYAKLWRSVSRQSELARIGDMVNWYADLLRG